MHLLNIINQAATAFRFLRHVINPSAPRPEAKSGSAPGSGTSFIATEENEPNS